jgi:hypothetical protein
MQDFHKIFVGEYSSRVLCYPTEFIYLFIRNKNVSAVLRFCYGVSSMFINFGNADC